MGSQPLLQEILPIHGVFCFRIALDPKIGRDAPNSFLCKENMGEIHVTKKWSSMWGMPILKSTIKLVRKTIINVILAKICPLLVDHKLQSSLTTNLLLPSLAFEDSTFELEFMKK